MARSYGGIRAHSNRIHTIDDVMDLYKVCRNTARKWIVEGVRPIDERNPTLILGAELNRFHAQRTALNRASLHPSQFKCFGCKGRVTPDVSTLRFEDRTESLFWVRAECPACGVNVRKLVNATTCNAFQTCQESNTSLDSLDEDAGAIPTGTGGKLNHVRPIWTPENERTLYAYQIYAIRFTNKTLDAKLAAIRHFEEFCGKRKFSVIRPEDASLYAAHLIDCGRSSLAKSTIQHRAAHLKSFFIWLVKQDGYRRLNKSISDCFKLRKAEAAKALQPPPRAYPTTEQLLLILNSMPTKNLVEKRDQAIVAATFLFGTRAGATASLRLKHIDVAARKVRQDASEVRVKNGKSQTTHWFPIGEPAEGILCKWVDTLRLMGCGQDDSLFPPDSMLDKILMSKPSRKPIEPWKTEHAIRVAFQRGCQSAGLP